MDLFMLSLRLAAYFRVAKDCCGTEMSCCYHQFIAQKPIELCFAEGDNQWRNATICAEKALNTSKSVQDDLDICCYYLTPEECKLDCLRSLRAPTLDGNAKMSFTERCEQYSTTANPFSCVARRQTLAHECFPNCLRLGRKYNPLEDCPGLKENDDWCIGDEVPRSEIPIAKT
uniref:DB domain-containing protein n=1 Tax=Syphacia muris TaxID=451379 RepID=A0A0N5ACW8_9BILA